MESIAMTKKCYNASSHMFEAEEVRDCFGLMFLEVDAWNMNIIHKLYKDYSWFGYEHLTVSDNQTDSDS